MPGAGCQVTLARVGRDQLGYVADSRRMVGASASGGVAHKDMSSTAAGYGTITATTTARTLTVNQSTDTEFSGIIQNGSATSVSLVKTGSGALTLSGANTYTGDTTVSGGTLALGADNVIGDVSDMIFNTGTTLETGGFDDTFGTLDINGSVIFDFESLGTSNLAFANSSGVTWGGDLDIINFTFDSDSIQFGTDSSGLLSSQLADISINGLDVTIDSNGFLAGVVHVPEPQSVALATLGLLSLGFVGWRRRRR